MQNRSLRDGESVVLIDSRGRRFLKRLKAGHRMTVRGTMLRADDLIGCNEGVTVGRREPERFLVFRPRYSDFVTLAPREAEPIFPKDAGMILTKGDVRPGNRVIEIGAGCGALTIALLRMTAPGGAVSTYEMRPEFAQQARANVREQCGDDSRWTVRIGDARRGFAERGVDHVIADMPEPRSLVEPAAEALRPGGGFLFYVPTVGQFSDAVSALTADPRFALVETFEVFERGWHVRAPSVRPQHRMVAHTGFLTTARRTAEAVEALDADLNHHGNRDSDR